RRRLRLWVVRANAARRADTRHDRRLRGVLRHEPASTVLLRRAPIRLRPPSRGCRGDLGAGPTRSSAASADELVEYLLVAGDRIASVAVPDDPVSTRGAGGGEVYLSRHQPAHTV